MTGSAWSALYTFFEHIWKFFNGFYFPGTNVTPAGILFLVLFASLIIRTVKRIFNMADYEEHQSRRRGK